MKKVILMVHGLDGGGTQKVVYELASYMSFQGLAVMVMVVNRHGKTGLKPGETCPFEVSVLSLIDSNQHNAAAFERLVSEWDAAPDAVFANTFESYRLLTLQSRVPVEKQYFVIHADYYTMYYRWYRPFKNRKRSGRYRALFNGRQLIVNSTGVATHLQQQIGVMPKTLVTIPPPIDCARIATLSKQVATESSLPQRYVVVVGSLTRLKRMELAIELLAWLPHDMALVVVGDGTERRALEKKARRFPGRVHFLGRLENPYPVIAGAHCLVSMSRSEGFSLVLVEAMTLGIMPLSIDSVGPNSILFERFSDCLVSDTSDRLEEMSRKVKQLPSYDKKALMMTAHQYDMDTVYRNYLALMD